MNRKIPSQFFCSSPFQILKKAYLRISKYLAQFFCSPPFSNIKKSILTNLKIPGSFFAYPFSNSKKSILTNLKIPLFILIIILKETIYIKIIIKTIPIKNNYTIKVKYIIIACIPVIIINFLLLFYKKKL